MEKVSRQRASKHNLRLTFKERWQPHSIEPKTLYIYYTFQDANLKKKSTPVKLPMSIWDKKRGTIKEEHWTDYKVELY